MPATISIASTLLLLKPAAPSRRRIRAFCERLEHGSERGTRRDDVRPGLRVVGFEHRITVAFIVEPERVVILRLFYGGANWSNELAGDNAG